jgi:hypothetical protein
MESFFFRVEHDLLRSELFKSLGGSAIKVYLVIGLYSNFGTGWAYPSIRTIAEQSGLSRQTVLTAIADLTKAGILVASKSQGRSTAYRIIRQAPEPGRQRPRKGSKSLPPTVPISLEVSPEPVQNLEWGDEQPVQKTGRGEAQIFGLGGPAARPKQDPGTREETHTQTIPIPGTPFRLSAEGRLLVSVDLQELLTDNGIPRRTAEKLAAQKAPEDVAKVLLNALYLQSQGKLQNGPGYIRAGIEDGYELLPQVANRLESRRRELEDRLRTIDQRRQRDAQEDLARAEEDAIALLLESLPEDELQVLVDKAVASLPAPLVKRNPSLSNRFVRGKVYELAGGEPVG